MRRRYLLLDVFTRSRFAGNPLAVFPEADGIEPEAMQRIAAELNLSETAYVQSPRPARRPGAGPDLHARVGTALRRSSDGGHRRGVAARGCSGRRHGAGGAGGGRVGGRSTGRRGRVRGIHRAEAAAAGRPGGFRPRVAARVIGVAAEQVTEATVWSAGGAVPDPAPRRSAGPGCRAAGQRGLGRRNWRRPTRSTSNLVAPDDGSATPPDHPDAPVVWHAPHVRPGHGHRRGSGDRRRRLRPGRPAGGGTARWPSPGADPSGSVDGAARASWNSASRRRAASAGGVTLGGWSVIVGEGVLETEAD